MTDSLNARAGRIVYVIVGGFFLLFALLGYALDRFQINRIADAQLAENARIIGALAELVQSDDAVKRGAAEALRIVRSRGTASQIGLQIWNHGNVLIVASDALRSLPLDAAPAGLSRLSVAGEPWRMYTLLSDNGRWVRVGESAEGLVETDRALLATALSSLLAVPLIALLMRRAVGLSVRSLNGVAEQIAAWRPHHVEPIGDDVPNELVPVVASINGLLRRVNQAMK